MTRADLEAAAEERYPMPLDLLPNGAGYRERALVHRERAAYIRGRLDQAEADAQKWEYRTLLNGGDPQPHSGLNSGRISLAEWFSLGDERVASGVLTLERRRVAGPWEQILAQIEEEMGDG